MANNISSTVNTDINFINTLFSNTLTLLNDMIINNTSNLLNNNNKILHSIQPSTPNNIIYNTSHESTPIIYPTNNNLTVNPKVLSFTQQAKSNIVLDSACTDSSYRASDVPTHSIISFAYNIDI